MIVELISEVAKPPWISPLSYFLLCSAVWSEVSSKRWYLCCWIKQSWFLKMSCTSRMWLIPWLTHCKTTPQRKKIGDLQL